MTFPVTQFTPLPALAGGALIGLAGVFLMVMNGRIAGVSGIVQRLFPPTTRIGILEALAFILGLAATPTLFKWLSGAPVVSTMIASPLQLAAAGLLVGFGAVMGNGCTSGHGVCGLARFSRRSLAATLTFMAAGFATIFVLRHVLSA